MIDIQDIKDSVRSQSYQRGRLIFQCQGVKNLQIEQRTDEDGYLITHVEARVKGCNNSYYTTEVEIDEDYSEIISSDCQCPAFATYYGHCKHCAALMLQYLQIRDAGHAGLFAKSNGKQVMEIDQPTESEMGKLLRSYGARNTAIYTQPSILGKIHLDPVLLMRFDYPELEFRIGENKRYVLKNISALIRAVNNLEEVTYGKNLQFVHHMKAFTPESQRILRFLMRRAEETRNSWSGLERTLPLTREGFERFHELMGSKSFQAKVSGHEEEWQFSEQPPCRVLTIKGEGQGIRLSMHTGSRYLSFGYVYYFDRGKIFRVDSEAEEEVLEFENYMNSWRGAGNYIAARDLPLFVRDLLPKLEKHYEIQFDGFDPFPYRPEKVSFELYLDAPQYQAVTCDLVAVYGEEKYHVFAGINEKSRRDVGREMEMGALVSSFCNALDERSQMGVILDDEEKIYELLTEGIKRFQEAAEVFVSDRLKNLKVISAPKIAVGISLSGELLELTMESPQLTLEELTAILSRYDRKKKFYRLKSGEFVNLQDDTLEALAQMKQGLQITDRQMLKGNIQVPKYRALFLDEQFREQEGIVLQKGRSFKSLVRNMKTVEDNDFEVPKSMESILRGYQKKGFLWIKTLKYNGFGGILADDMGLGKTLQVIACLLSEYQELETGEWRTLIVCPSSLVYNWQSEFNQYAPQLPVTLVVGSAPERQAILKSPKEQVVYVTSYELLKRDIEIYREITFHNQIIDEAQYIKNHGTQAAQAVKKINAGFKLALTGTPVENRLSELWSIFDYLMPGYLYGYQKFKEEFEIPVVTEQEESVLLRLQKMIHPFVLRRLKKDVLKDLPEKLEKNLYAKMDGEQQELYQAHVKRLQMILAKQSVEEFDRSRIQVLAELTKLRQLCCDPALLLENYKGESAKLELCMELVERAVESGHKILLFSQFTSMLDRICKRLKKQKVSYYLLTGATEKEERMRLVQAFNQDNTSVFCISLKAGGTGLNLTAADMVIHYDPWWNTAVQNQATDRAHRIGQKNTVMVYRLIAKETIEEKIVGLQERKQMLAEQVLGGGALDKSSFTREELLEILSGA